MIRSVWELVRHPIRAIDARRVGVDFVGLRVTTLVLSLLLIPAFYGAEMVCTALDHGHGRPLFTTILLIVSGLLLAVAGVYLLVLAIVLMVKQVTATPQQGSTAANAVHATESAGGRSAPFISGRPVGL